MSIRLFRRSDCLAVVSFNRKLRRRRSRECARTRVNEASSPCAAFLGDLIRFRPDQKKMRPCGFRRKTPTMQVERNHYLAVIRPENLAKLLDFNLSFYAFHTRRRGTAIKKGDRMVLYRSRGLGGDRVPGVIGVFEVTSAPQLAGDTSGMGDSFLNLFPIQVPWRSIVTSIDKPLPLAPLVPKLAVFQNKTKYGSVLQTTLKRLSQQDYQVIESALEAHARSVS